MALITDFASLKAAVAQYQWRTGDADFEGAVDGMIQLAGARLNRKLSLRLMDADAQLTGAQGSRTVVLPADFVEPYALSLTTFGAPTPLRASIAGQMSLSEGQGTPSAWAVDGANITFNSPLDRVHTFTLRYRKSFVLSEAVPTNWLIENHPDIYLAAVCTWGGLFMLDADQASMHKGILEEGLTELAWQESRSASLATLSVDAALLSRSGFDITTG